MKSLLSPWHTLLVLAGASILAACEPSPPSPTVAPPPTASAPNAPPPATSDAVQGLGADAATVAASAEKTNDGSARPVSNTTASPLGELRSAVGTYPSDGNVSFLEQGVLAERIKQLLGKEYATLLSNMRTVSPLQEDAGRWFITGNRPHEGGTEAAAVVIDAAQNAVRVWMLHEGKAKEYQDPNHVNVPWPQDVQTMLDNAQAASKG